MACRALLLRVGLAACLAPWAAGSASADCTCRAGGRDFALGQSACLRTPTGFRLATCGMVLNNSSWRLTDVPCVGVEHAPARPGGHGGAPVAPAGG